MPAGLEAVRPSALTMLRKAGVLTYLDHVMPMMAVILLRCILHAAHQRVHNITLSEICIWLILYHYPIGCVGRNGSR